MKPMDLLRSLFPAGSGPAHTIMASKVEENPARYCSGGYHPVVIGDVYMGRYQVIRKLGFGQYSTVWLTRDLRLVLYLTFTCLV